MTTRKKSPAFVEPRVKWLGSTTCNFCRYALPAAFIDGRTIHGPWAVMCARCWPVHGNGRLGEGFGQRYEPDPADGFYYKVDPRGRRRTHEERTASIARAVREARAVPAGSEARGPFRDVAGGCAWCGRTVPGRSLPTPCDQCREKSTATEPGSTMPGPGEGA